LTRWSSERTSCRLCRGPGMTSTSPSNLNGPRLIRPGVTWLGTGLSRHADDAVASVGRDKSQKYATVAVVSRTHFGSSPIVIAGSKRWSGRIRMIWTLRWPVGVIDDVAFRILSEEEATFPRASVSMRNDRQLPTSFSASPAATAPGTGRLPRIFATPVSRRLEDCDPFAAEDALQHVLAPIGGFSSSAHQCRIY